MLALIGNLSLGEALVIAVLAVLVFGRRLPEVAARGAHALRRFRRTLDDLRRESGFDEELRRVRSTMREVRHEARLEDALRPPPETRASHRPRRDDPQAAGDAREEPPGPGAPPASGS